LGLIEPLIKFEYRRPLFAKSNFTREFNLEISDKSFPFISGPSDDYYNNFDSLYGQESACYLYNWVQVCGQSQFVVDIGAYTGLYSTLAGLSGTKVTAFEPNRFVFNRMQKNIKKNFLSDLVNLRAVALGDLITFSNTLIPKNQRYSSGLQLEFASTDRDLSEWVYGKPVEVSTLDFELRDVVAPLGAIKIDAEGFELEILRGAKDIIKSDKPIIFIECLSATRLQQCTNYLNTIGVQLKKIDYCDSVHNNFILHLI
jgi:FkbM family methyltransferase